MLSPYLYLVLITAGLLLGAYWHYRAMKAQLVHQQKQIEQIQREAKAIAKELESAEKANQIKQHHQPLSADAIDEQLQHKGYFRTD